MPPVYVANSARRLQPAHTHTHTRPAQQQQQQQQQCRREHALVCLSFVKSKGIKEVKKRGGNSLLRALLSLARSLDLSLCLWTASPSVPNFAVDSLSPTCLSFALEPCGATPRNCLVSAPTGAALAFSSPSAFFSPSSCPPSQPSRSKVPLDGRNVSSGHAWLTTHYLLQAPSDRKWSYSLAADNSLYRPRDVIYKQILIDFFNPVINNRCLQFT